MNYILFLQVSAQNFVPQAYNVLGKEESCSCAGLGELYLFVLKATCIAMGKG